MITIISSVMFGYGLFSILASILKFPNMDYIKPMLRFKNKSDNENFIDKIKNKVYFRLLNVIKIDVIKRRKLEKVLFLANIEKTPEEYTAEGLADLITLIGIGAILALMSPIVTLGVTIFSVLRYINYINEPKEKIKENRELIESQLYRFTSTIEQELIIDNDVIRILESFTNNTNEVFKRQLQITLTEMRTTNEINGLLNLQSRINSTMLSEVVRGLISLLRGESNREYFRTLSNNFKSAYLSNKRKVASLLPSKLKKYEMLLFLAVGIIIFTMLISEIISSSSQIF